MPTSRVVKMDKPTLEEIKQEAIENDLRDSLEWNEYIKTIEYINEQKREDIVDVIYKKQKGRNIFTNKIEKAEDKYIDHLSKNKPSQELKQDILELYETIENYNNEIYELLEELENIGGENGQRVNGHVNNTNEKN